MISHYFVEATQHSVEALYPEHITSLPKLLSNHESGEFLELDCFYDYLRKLEELVKDPDVGLKLGAHLSPSGFNLQGQIVMSCRTLGEALPLVLQFHTLIMPESTVHTYVEGEYVGVDWITKDSQTMPRVFCDLIVASTCHFGAWITNGRTYIPKISFPYARPKCVETYKSMFGGEQYFDAAHTSIALPNRWSELEIKTASINVKPILCDHARKLLNEMDRRSGFRNRIEALLEKMVAEGHVNLSALAEKLGTSPRTLQRTLQKEELSFSRLLQNARVRASNKLLLDTKLSVTEIGLSLGYQSSSAFSKAYKSWTGLSPILLREQAAR